MADEKKNGCGCVPSFGIETWSKDVDRKLDALLVKVERTNGRVTALEKWKYGLLVGIGTLAATRTGFLGDLFKALILPQ